MTNEEFIESIKLHNEEWRDVVGYEGYYMVSSLGRVAVMSRTVFRKHRNGKPSNFQTKNHLTSVYLTPSATYKMVTFVVKGKRKSKHLHRVLAEAFIPNPLGYTCIDHIDDNPLNNDITNLQWCDYKINNSKEHHREQSLITRVNKLPVEKRGVVSIDKDGVVTHYRSLGEAARCGHTKQRIWSVLNGNNRTHHGLKWLYLHDYKSLVKQNVNELS